MAKSGAAAMELDFFHLEKEPTTNKILERAPVPFEMKDIQHGVSTMNLEVVKSLIASSPSSVASSPKEDQHQTFRSNTSYQNKNESNSGPLTIFYNGSAMVYDASPKTAENILKLAMESSKTVQKSESNDSKSSGGSIDHRRFLTSINSGDMPIARRKSLGRFLEKRRERMTFASPYVYQSATTNSMSAGLNNA